MDRYVAALILEIRALPESMAPQTIFFGGGTPSLLDVRSWNRIFEAMSGTQLTRNLVEFTVECNPATVSREKAAALRAGGVNRVSMGVQSMDADLLSRLGRVHSRDSVFKSFNLFREVGFENINLDLMFGIPGQSTEQWDATLDEILALDSESLACYEVIYEEDTPLYHALKAGEFDVNDERNEAMFERLLERADAAGFQQYEVANFARGPVREGDPHFACQHNINYWRGGQYEALGPSACGYLNGVRFRNWSNTETYCDWVERGERPIEETDPLSPRARAGEIAAFGLRMNRGWDFDEFHSVTGFRLEDEWRTPLDRLAQRGWAIETPERFRLNSDGLRFADAAGAEFITEQA